VVGGTASVFRAEWQAKQITRRGRHNINRVIKSRRLRWVMQAASMDCVRIVLESLRRRNRLEGLWVDCRIILK
jgi:ribosomal silencing factor RsfS